MRLERKGHVSRLTPDLERFIVEALGGKALDDLQHPEARKADYKCLRGLLVIELKSLEDDGSKRLGNLFDEFRERADFPFFLGSAPIGSIVKHLDEPEKATHKVFDRMGRAIKNHLHKANKQLAAHAVAFPRKNVVKAVVLVNEDHEIYDPENVAFIVQRLLMRREGDALLYPNIDAVFFLSQRHAAFVNGQISFPTLCIEGIPIELDEWKREVTELFLTRWAKWRGVQLHHSEMEGIKFTTIDHIPDQMKRHEGWELDYKRNRYMRSFSKEQLRKCFDELICITSLAFVKGSPSKPNKDMIEWSMSTMSHMMLEMGWRGIPTLQFKQDSMRLAAAATRLGMPLNIVTWFENNMSH